MRSETSLLAVKEGLAGQLKYGQPTSCSRVVCAAPNAKQTRKEKERDVICM